MSFVTLRAESPAWASGKPEAPTLGPATAARSAGAEQPLRGRARSLRGAAPRRPLPSAAGCHTARARCRAPLEIHGPASEKIPGFLFFFFFYNFNFYFLDFGISQEKKDTQNKSKQTTTKRQQKNPQKTKTKKYPACFQGEGGGGREKGLPSSPPPLPPTSFYFVWKS